MTDETALVRGVESAPKSGERILMYGHRAGCRIRQWTVGFWNGRGWTSVGGWEFKPSHWHPLPSTPEMKR